MSTNFSRAHQSAISRNFVEQFQLLHTYGRRHSAVNWATFEIFHCKHSQHVTSPLERILSKLQLPSILIRLHMAIQVYKFGIDVACAKDPLYANGNWIKGYVVGLILPEERIPRLSEWNTFIPAEVLATSTNPGSSHHAFLSFIWHSWLQGLQKRRHETHRLHETAKTEYVHFFHLSRLWERRPNWTIMCVSYACPTLNFIKLSVTVDRRFPTGVTRNALVPQNIIRGSTRSRRTTTQ